METERRCDLSSRRGLGRWRFCSFKGRDKTTLRRMLLRPVWQNCALDNLKHVPRETAKLAVMTRRELLTLAAAAPALPGLLRANNAPVAPVAIAKCPTYDQDLT